MEAALRSEPLRLDCKQGPRGLKARGDLRKGVSSTIGDQNSKTLGRMGTENGDWGIRVSFEGFPRRSFGTMAGVFLLRGNPSKTRK